MEYRSIIIEALRKRDGNHCSFCLDEFSEYEVIHLDHIKPRSSGGLDSLDNLQLAHAQCNIVAQDKRGNWEERVKALKRRKKTERIVEIVQSEGIVHIPEDVVGTPRAFRFLLYEVLRRSDGDKKRAADVLGVSLKTVYRYLE